MALRSSPGSSVPPLPVDAAWSLLAQAAPPRVDTAQWVRQANTFFAAEVTLVQQLSDAGGVLPDSATLELDVRAVAHGDALTRVRVVTLPVGDAPAVRAAADAGVAAIGGAGFELLVPRARQVWQVRATPVGGGDPRAPLVVAGVIALVLLAPLVPPGGGTIFGVKGARLRLEALGWPRPYAG